MLLSKCDLVQELIKACEENIKNKGWLQAKVNLIYKNFGIPKDVAVDLLTMKTDLNDANNFILYAITKGVLGSDNIGIYFSEHEIAVYDTERYQVETIEFPITLDMIEITPQQWVGPISVKQLMAYRDARLIRYNENAQRALKRVVHGEETTYKISLSKSAVNSIRDSYEAGTYIPNMITLNIPEDAEVRYDRNKKTLTILSAEYFDILDGYHRYISLSQICNKDPNFDYQMELRLVRFSEEMAKQFIWQEDQKTKMKKIVSDTYNQFDFGNQVVSEVNQTAPLLGRVGINYYILNPAVLSSCINRLFAHDKKPSRSSIIFAKEKIIKFAKLLDDENPSAFDKAWDDVKVVAFAICAFIGVKTNATHVLDSLYNNILQDNMYKNGKVSYVTQALLNKYVLVAAEYV